MVLPRRVLFDNSQKEPQDATRRRRLLLWHKVVQTMVATRTAMRKTAETTTKNCGTLHRTIYHRKKAWQIQIHFKVNEYVFWLETAWWRLLHAAFLWARKIPKLLLTKLKVNDISKLGFQFSSKIKLPTFVLKIFHVHQPISQYSFVSIELWVITSVYFRQLKTAMYLPVDCHGTRIWHMQALKKIF